MHVEGNEMIPIKSSVGTSWKLSFKPGLIMFAIGQNQILSAFLVPFKLRVLRSIRSVFEFQATRSTPNQ